MTGSSSSRSITHVCVSYKEWDYERADDDTRNNDLEACIARCMQHLWLAAYKHAVNLPRSIATIDRQIRICAIVETPDWCQLKQFPNHRINKPRDYACHLWSRHCSVIYKLRHYVEEVTKITSVWMRRQLSAVTLAVAVVIARLATIETRVQRCWRSAALMRLVPFSRQTAFSHVYTTLTTSKCVESNAYAVFEGISIAFTASSIHRAEIELIWRQEIFLVKVSAVIPSLP